MAQRIQPLRVFLNTYVLGHHALSSSPMNFKRTSATLISHHDNAKITTAKVEVDHSGLIGLIITFASQPHLPHEPSRK